MADDLAAVLQISASSASAVVTGLAHRSVDGCCIREPVHTSAWVTDATFARDSRGNDVVRITADTAIAGEVTTDLPLADALREADDSLRDATQQLTDALGVTVTGRRYRVRSGDLLTLYALYDSANPQHSIDDVSGSILSKDGVDYDFGAWIPKPVIKAYIERLLGGISHESIRVTGYSVDIGDTLKISVGGVTRGFRCNASISIGAEYVFVVGEGGMLGIQRVAWSWYIPKIQGWVAEHYYKEEIDTAIAQATDPNAFFAPVRVRIGIPPTDSVVADVGTFQASAAQLSGNGLRIWGQWLDQEPQPPQISFLPDGTITTVEEADSACRKSTPAVFADRTISIGNWQQRAKLYVCDVHVEGHAGFTIGATTIPGAQVASDGRSLTGLDDGGGRGSVTVRYRGDRTTARDATLVVMANDPQRLVTRIPLRTLATGPADFRVDPADTLEVHYYNTRTDDTGGTAVVATEDCRTGQVRQRPQNLQAPGTVTVYNTGNGPLYVCDVVVEDHSGTWDTLLLDKGPALPGESIQIPVYFYGDAVGFDYWSLLDITFHDGQTHFVHLHGLLEPEAQSVKSQSRTPGVNIDLVVDLYGERLCMPNNADICAARRYLEPVKDPGRPLGLVRIGPVPPSGRVTLQEPDGTVDVVDTAGTAIRDIIIEFPDPGGGGGGGGWNPCIAQFDGIPADALSKIRMSVRGLVLEPAPDLPVKGVTAVAGDGNVLFVATKDGLTSYGWSDGVPKPRGDVPGLKVSTLAAGDGIVVTAAGDELMVWHADDPRRRGALRLPGQATAVALDGSVAWVLTGDRILLVDTRPGTPAIEKVLPLPEPGALLTVGSGMVSIVGEKHLIFFPTDRPDDVQQMVLPARALHIHSDARGAVVTGKFGTHEYELAKKPRLLRQYRLPHWTSEFQPFGRELIQLADGRVQRWTAATHRIDRNRFRDAFVLRYKPPRVTP